MNNSETNDLFSEMGYTNSQGVQVTEEEKEREDLELAQKQQREIAEVVEAYITEQENRSNNYALGFLGALAGAFIGAIPWAIIEYFGYFAGYLGFLIVWLSAKGYDLLKVKSNSIKILCVIISSVIGVFVGQIICDIIHIATAPELKDYFAGIPDIISHYMSNMGYYLGLNAENLTMGIIFVFLGGFIVIRDIREENKSVKNYKKSEH